MGAREDWERLTSELAAHPWIRVVDVRFGPPAPEAILQVVEAEFGFPLPPSMTEFYRTFNGLKIEWTLNREQMPDEVFLRIAEHEYYTTLETAPAALINIQSVEGSLLESGYLTPMFRGAEADLDDEVTFKGRTWTNREMVQRLKPFDIFDTFHGDRCMAFFVDSARREMDVLLLVEHFAGWNYSRLTDFESYVRFLFTTRGLTRARALVFEDDGGDAKPRRAFRESDQRRFVPQLFRRRPPR